MGPMMMICLWKLPDTPADYRAETSERLHLDQPFHWLLLCRQRITKVTRTMPFLQVLIPNQYPKEPTKNYKKMVEDTTVEADEVLLPVLTHLKGIHPISKLQRLKSNHLLIPNYYRISRPIVIPTMITFYNYLRPKRHAFD